MFEKLKSIFKKEKSSENNEKSSEISLKDFSDYGYDISMFKNPLTGNQCDLSYTYGELRIVNNVDELTPNYIINTNLTCEE